MRITVICTLLFVLAISVDSFAQRRRHFGGHKSGANSAWVFGAHWHFVDNDGQKTDFHKIGSVWGGTPYPSKLTVERYLSTEWSAEVSAAFGKLGAGQIVGGEPLPADQTFNAFEIAAKYRFVRFFIIPGFDPYVSLGTGLSYFDPDRYITINPAVGFNTWLANGLGLNFQVKPTWRLRKPPGPNYFHYSFGVVYRYFPSDIGARRLIRKQNLFGQNHPYSR